MDSSLGRKERADGRRVMWEGRWEDAERDGERAVRGAVGGRWEGWCCIGINKNSLVGHCDWLLMVVLPLGSRPVNAQTNLIDVDCN